MTAKRAPLRLVLDPAPVLHHRSAPVRVFDAALRQLVDGMFQRCEEWGGVGLAAPQVGSNLQVAVIIYEGRHFAICNPEVLASDGEVDASEGCLSLPEQSGLVRRYERSTIRYRNVQGKGVQRDFEGWLSRIVQHESDHLVGILCPERLAPGASFGAVSAGEDADEAATAAATPRRRQRTRRAGAAQEAEPAGAEL